MDKNKNFKKEINYVSKETIHKENVSTERKYELKNFKNEYTFSPYTFYPFTEKPTKITPNRPFTSKDLVNKMNKRDYKINKDPIQSAFTTDKITTSIRNHHDIPKNLYQRPMTSAHEVGWFTKPLMDNKKWNRPKSSTAITRYGSDYQMLYNKNPFTIPVSNFKMK